MRVARTSAPIATMLALALAGLACASAGSTARPPAGAADSAPAVGAPTATPAPVALRYAYSASSVVFLPQKIALEQGFYRQYGLEMEQLIMGAGVLAAAQLSGEVEYSNSYPASIRAAAQGSPLRIVSTVVNAPLFAFVARPEYHSLTDLRGQAIGITTRGGAVDKVTRTLFGQVGMNVDSDITILPSGGQVTVLLDALLSGRVQGAALSAPWYGRARDQGMRVLIKAPEVVREPQNGLSVTTDRLTRQRDQVRQVVQAEAEAVRFIRQNRAATVAYTQQWLEISAADAEESYDFVLPAFVEGRIDVPGLLNYVAEEKADGTLPADFQVESILDTALAEEALRALGG